MRSKQPIYKSLSDLEPVRNLLEEAGKAIDNKTRTLSVSAIPPTLGAIGGASVGAAAVAGSVAVGTGSAGVTAGITGVTAGLIGGSAAATIGVVAGPAALLGITGYWALSVRNRRKREEAKQAYCQEAIRKRDAILREAANTNKRNTERIAYLEKLVASLIEIIQNLETDLRVARGS